MSEAGLEPYLSRPLTPPDPAVLAAIESGPVDPARALPLSGIDCLLDPVPLLVETGWCFRSDRVGYVAVRTAMPGVSAEMVEWWFDWHPRDPDRYRAWHPLAHIGNSIEPPAAPAAKAHWGAVHHPVEDVGTGVVHARIAFLRPSALGFSTDALGNPDVATVVCGYVGDDRRRLRHSAMAHVFLREEDGLVLRSHFWLGAAVRPYLPAPVAAPIAWASTTAWSAVSRCRRACRGRFPPTAPRSTPTWRRCCRNCTGASPLLEEWKLLAAAEVAAPGEAARDHPGVPTHSIFAERFAAQALSGPPERDAARVAERLLAVQGQDPRGARLAIRARTEGLTAADVDRALSEERSLLITWLNRGTLHLVRSEDYPWLHALTTPPLQTSAKRRLSQEGVSPAAAERGVETIERALAEEGPLTRLQLRERLEAAGVPTEGQALIHLLFLATLRGIAVRGPMVGSDHAYVLLGDWLDPPAPVDRDAALAELARRYLVGHAPADDRDLARWAGLPLRDARAGLAAIASELVEREDGLVHLAAHPPIAELPRPRLIGAFDPVLLGWTSREAILGPHRHLVTLNGIFRPFAMVKGRAVANWRLNRGKVSIEPLEPIAKRASAALAADAADVERFMAGA